MAPTSNTGDNRIRRSATDRSPALPSTRRYQEPGAACSLVPRSVPPTSWATAKRSLALVEGRNVTSNKSGCPPAVPSHAAPRALSTGAGGGGAGRAGGAVLSAPGRGRVSPGATAVLPVSALSGGTARAESGAGTAPAFWARHGEAVSTTASATSHASLFFRWCSPDPQNRGDVMRSLLHASAIFLLLASVACAGGSGGGDPAPDSSAKVRIENRSSSDMDIYVRPSLDRPIRLGFVPASDTVEFALARALIAGSAGFRLEARPVRAAGRPVLSDPLTARAGDEIFWSIPPQ